MKKQTIFRPRKIKKKKKSKVLDIGNSCRKITYNNNNNNNSINNSDIFNNNSKSIQNDTSYVLPKPVSETPPTKKMFDELRKSVEMNTPNRDTDISNNIQQKKQITMIK
eukprot:UN31614